MKKETEIDSLRKSSLMWWNNELTQEQRDFHFSGYEKFTPAKHSSELTGREIQNIWAVNQNPPTSVKETEPRFNWQRIDEQDNKPELQTWVDEDRMEALIDENKGGIIGYINTSHIEEVVKILNGSKETEPAPTPTSKEGLEDRGFTPGEWEASYNSEEFPGQAAIYGCDGDTNGRVIAVLDTSDQTDMANIDLICAAPIMYDLLKWVVNEIETTPDELSDALLGMIKIKCNQLFTRINKH